MKNLDIEKLERKTPYKLPENFFNEMQANVLAQTTQKEQPKQAKIYKINFGWAVAAAIALIFGLGFLFFNLNKEQTPQQIAQNIKNDTAANPRKTLAINDIPAPVNENTTAYQTLKSDIVSVQNVEKYQQNTVAKTSSPKNIQKFSRTDSAVKSTKNIDYQHNAAKNGDEKMMETILAGFSPEDIKQISKNTEQDVYLDLYN